MSKYWGKKVQMHCTHVLTFTTEQRLKYHSKDILIQTSIKIFEIIDNNFNGEVRKNNDQMLERDPMEKEGDFYSVLHNTNQEEDQEEGHHLEVD